MIVRMLIRPNKEACILFLAAGLWFPRKIVLRAKELDKSGMGGKNALKYMELSRGEEEFNPELLLGDAPFNYFSVGFQRIIPA